MGIFDFLRRKSDRHELSQDERENGGETRSIKLALTRRKQELEMARLELEAEKQKIRYEYEIEKAKQDLEDLRDEYSDDDGEEEKGSEDILITTLLSQLLAKQQPQQAAIPITPVQVKTTIEEQEIEKIWNTLDKNQQKTAKKMPDDALKAVILGSAPMISDETLNKAVEFVRNAKV